jgi:sugar phosphate isomerase/epimerase
MSSKQRRAAIDLLRGCGLVVSTINASTLFATGDTYHPTWIEDDPHLRQQRLDHTLNAMELGAELGVRTISIQAGGPMIGTGLSRQRAGDRFAEGVASILPYAKERGIILGIEPEPGLFIESAAEFMEFKNRYFKNDDMVRMNCDVGHLYCVGEDPAEIIRGMPEEICHLDLEDVGKQRVHEHRMPGEGQIDFRAIFHALRDVHYNGWATVQLYPSETKAAEVAKRAYDHLSPMLREVMPVASSTTIPA